MNADDLIDVFENEQKKKKNSFILREYLGFSKKPIENELSRIIDIYSDRELFGSKSGNNTNVESISLKSYEGKI
jgi:hypothetical protein